MKFYIHPDNKPELEKKLARMFKKLTTVPTVEYSEVKTVVKHTLYDYGSDGHDHKREIIKAIEVTINGLDIREWSIVAEVDYRDSAMLICNSKMFKNIPKQYGLKYTKCDHCGGSRHRITSFVMYNNITNKWMQVGSSCVNKLVNGGKYLANMIIELYDYVKCLGGCTDEFSFYGGGWKAPEKWRAKAVSMEAAVQLCKNVWDEKNGEIKWVKPEYEYGKKVKNGTNDWLMEEMLLSSKEIKINKQYLERVKSHVATLDSENEFNKNMQDAFDNEFIEVQQMYLAFFAMKSYEDSIKFADFESELAAKGIEKEKKIALTCKLIAKEMVSYEDYYTGGTTLVTYLYFKDTAGFTYVKSVSYTGVVSSYCTETLDDVTESDYVNKTYKFNCSVKYISCKKKEIGLGGRLSKYNEKKADLVL